MNRYSYSGSDSKPYVFFPTNPSEIYYLESMHTVSFSVHEAKGDARTLGYRNIRGFTRSVRTIAGSMIFIVIEDHPLRTLLKNAKGYAGWSVDQQINGVGDAISGLNFNNRLPTLLPPFNLLVTYVSEAVNSITASGVFAGSAKGAAVLLEGIEFIDDGMVTSINDVVSEISYSFKARNMRTLAASDINNIQFTELGRTSGIEQLYTSLTRTLDKQIELSQAINSLQGTGGTVTAGDLEEEPQGGNPEQEVEISSLPGFSEPVPFSSELEGTRSSRSYLGRR